MNNCNNIRFTKQRKILLEEVKKLHSHPTADEIYQRVRSRLPHVSLGTVYRNLELLSRSGIIRKLEIGGHQKRFDGDLGAHQHVRCIRCGRIEDVAGEPSPTECDRNALKEMGYELVDRRVEFLGICPRCRAGEDGGGSGGI